MNVDDSDLCDRKEMIGMFMECSFLCLFVQILFIEIG